jgi:hypothetical protein
MSTLSLINTDVDISALETIKQFEKLTILNISSGNLSPADFKMIQQALPKVKVTRAREPFR